MQDQNHNGIPDSHEAKMAKADLYKLANYSMKLFKVIHEGDQLEGWVQAKITKAADYVASVYHFMEYEMKVSEYGDHLESAEIYSESVRRAFAQKLNEAKAAKEKISKKNKKDIEEARAADEPAEPDETAIAKRKRLQALKDKQEDERAERGDSPAKKKTNVRKVSGKAYGGSAQVDEAKAADTLPDVDKTAAQKRKDRQARMDKLEDEKAAKANDSYAEPKKATVRKVAGKAYGGSKQKDDAVEEGFGYNKFGEKNSDFGSKGRRDADRDDEGWARTKKADDKWNKEVAAKAAPKAAPKK